MVVKRRQVAGVEPGPLSRLKPSALQEREKATLKAHGHPFDSAAQRPFNLRYGL